jgi:hypothetical protein
VKSILFYCERCDETFYFTREELTEHMRTKHPLKQKETV